MSPPLEPPLGRSSKVAPLLAAWLACVTAGFLVLAVYEKQPGPSADAPSDWPAGCALPPPAGRHVLVMFGHPHCPCTRASMSELERIAARTRGRLDVHVVFYADRALGDGWERGDLWEQATAIPHARVWSDPEGVLAGRFDARTSGQALVYAPDGRLVFRGGITGSRGHAGDNEGKNAVLDLVQGGEPESDGTPVFGCALSSIPGELETAGGRP